MRSLFWKIFISFWVALILFTLTTVWIAGALIEKKRGEHHKHAPRAYMQMLVAQAQAAADRQGVAGLQRWALRLDRRETVPFLLLDQQGRELLDRPIPDNLRYALERLRQSPGNHALLRQLMDWPLIDTPDGGRYRLIPDVHNITLGRALGRPRAIALPLVLAGLISAVVCLMLARYLTGPLTRLHRAAEEFSHGNLTTRVAPALGKRKDEIANLARAFDHMAERLNHLLGTQKQLLRDVSHELRSPLARMQVALELARSRDGGNVDKELDRIALEAQRLDDLIAQLLSLARLDALSQPTETETIDMAALLGDVIDDARFEAQTQQRQLKLHASETLHVNGDPALLHSAVENIVRNAIRHTAAQTAVEITLQRDPKQRNQLALSIRDHGPGVPGDMLKHIFEPFVRADSARSRDQGGHGLGLAIAQRVVQLHGGALSARNASGGGLCLTLRLPLLKHRK